MIFNRIISRIWYRLWKKILFMIFLITFYEIVSQTLIHFQTLYQHRDTNRDGKQSFDKTGALFKQYLNINRGGKQSLNNTGGLYKQYMNTNQGSTDNGNQNSSLELLSERPGPIALHSFNKSEFRFEEVCDTLINKNDKNFVNQIKKLKIKRRILSPDFYLNITKNCDQFISQMGLITDSSKEEKDFPIAFGIVIFKDVDQVGRLLRAIYRPHNLYCFHIDSKQPILFYRTIESIVSCLPNVWLASRLVDVKWSTFTILEAELICQRELYAHKTKWRYYINLTGQEYPLKTNYELVRILKAYQGANDILGYQHILNSDRVNPKIPPPHNIKVCKGSLHITASRAFVHYVLFNQTAVDFLKFCKTMKFPDESYFNSLNNNPHLKIPGSYVGDIESNDRQELSRYKIWYDHSKCGSRKFRRGICIFGMADLPILTTTPQLFANKFHYDFEPLAYDCLEWWYRKKVNKEIKGQSNFSVKFYENTTFVKHRLV